MIEQLIKWRDLSQVRYLSQSNDIRFVKLHESNLIEVKVVKWVSVKDDRYDWDLIILIKSQNNIQVIDWKKYW